MEKTDYSKVSLLDVGFNSDWSFYNTFLRYGIKTLDQVLDDATMKEVLQHIRLPRIRDELLGFIDQMKFSFLGIPLISDVYLDQPAKSIETMHQKDCPVNFSRMGFLQNNSGEGHMMQLLYHRYKDGKPDDLEGYTLFDFFQSCVKNYPPKTELERKMQLYLDSYQKSYGSDVTLDMLREQLVQLYKKKKDIDKQITSLEETINSISKGRRAV